MYKKILWANGGSYQKERINVGKQARMKDARYLLGVVPSVGFLILAKIFISVYYCFKMIYFLKIGKFTWQHFFYTYRTT